MYSQVTGPGLKHIALDSGPGLKHIASDSGPGLKHIALYSCHFYVYATKTAFCSTDATLCLHCAAFFGKTG